MEKDLFMCRVRAATLLANDDSFADLLLSGNKARMPNLGCIHAGRLWDAERYIEVQGQRFLDASLASMVSFTKELVDLRSRPLLYYRQCCVRANKSTRSSNSYYMMYQVTGNSKLET